MNMRQIDDAAERYKRAGTEEEQLRYEFFRQLFHIQNEEAARLGGMHPFDAPDAATLEERYWRGEAVLKAAPVRIDPEEFAAVCANLAAHMSGYEGIASETGQALEGFDWLSFARRCRLDRAQKDPSAFLDECWENYNLIGLDGSCNPRVFMILLSSALRPFLQPASTQVMDALAASVKTNQEYHSKPLRCPVCGAHAQASYVGGGMALESHGRKLYCALCGAVWDFERIRCACCGTRNQEHLHWFHVEDDPAHRIHVCDECGGYMRTVFQDDLHAAICMEVEDIAMSYLDEVAQKSGVLS